MYFKRLYISQILRSQLNIFQNFVRKQFCQYSGVNCQIDEPTPTKIEDWDKIDEYSTVSHFQKLIESDEDKRKLEFVLNGYNLALERTGDVPSFVSLKHMKNLMNCESHKGLRRLLKLINKAEIAYFVKLRKRELRKIGVYKGSSNSSVQFHTGVSFNEETGAPKYGLWKNSLFTRLSNQTMSYADEVKLFNSSMFGQHLILDLSYEKFMKQHEITNTVEELIEIYSYNKNLSEPYNLWFCNCSNETLMSRLLRRFFSESMFTRSTEDTYLNHFPNDRLVYLSPDAETPLLHYDHDDIYIIGAFLDSEYEKDVSRSKALKEGIRMRRLPINEFVNIFGSKHVLTMPQVALILMDLKRGRDWKMTLERRIPKRRIINPEKMHKFVNKKQFVVQN